MKDRESTSLNIAYIRGGSRAWARTFMVDLALEPALGGVIRLYDIDENAAKDNAIIGNRISDMPQACGKWKYVVAHSLQEALTGSDFIIISILPGTFEEMRCDVHLPERLGIYQSVGDTAGPGGIVRALRTIPMYVEFAHAIREYVPDAWVINYTNPMSVCVKTLYHAFPQIKAIGCCHEVFSTQSLLEAMVQRELGVEQTSRDEIHINVMGLNHFTWIDRASYKGHDLFGMYSRFTDQFYDSGFQNDDSELPNQRFTCTNRVKFDLFRRYGWIAAAGDRHLAEFMPGEMYLKDPETVAEWGYHLTDVDWRIEDLQRKRAKSAVLAAGTETIPLMPSGEEGILLIKALCGLTRVVSNVNLPNFAGQISNLPKETVVETNALFSFNSVLPVAAGSLTDELCTLMKPHIENQNDVLKAALDCDQHALYRAFGRDPLIAGRCNEKDIRALADDMVHNTITYLPDGWKR